ncbi:hypothetical protein F1D05_10550 [Kribbella qitaiheensis]|uniref:Uncharacterized protein n=1 Tax=Kribbella qitaiheensis TaxID=1544730 RepID=A0A7G6WW92_9ACTN|nr:hypothetical protein [Kribbella qitaiheensis]QNE18257.1 hypothetical protein F1D05_10550 [Kribbella qitaiheensis]
MSDKRANVLAQEVFGEAVNSGNLNGFDDLVAVGTVDDGPAPGLIPGPSGYQDLIKVRGLQIGRFVVGKLVERWGGSDQLGSMTRLGLVAV